MELEQLLERVKAANGPDRELDHRIWLALEPGVKRKQWSYTHTASGRECHVDETRDATGRLVIVPAYTASIDAALALVERVLPGWFWRSGHVPHRHWDGTKYRDNWAHLSRTDASNCDRGDEATGWADSVPLAILAALLTALIAQKRTASQEDKV